MWFEALPTFLALAAVVLLPGLALGYAVGLRGLSAWGVAPPLSVSLLGVLGIVAGVAHIPWNVGVLAVGTAASCVLAALAARIFHLRVRPGRHVDDLNVTLAGLGGAAIGAVLQAAVVLRGIGRPSSISQTPDVMFHLNRMRTMLDSGDISSLVGGFYPSAFHDVVVSAVQVAPASLVVASNLGALLTAAVIWPLGCIALARQVFGPRPLALLATGLASSAFVAFPAFLLSWGVLWPNAIGLSLVPGTLSMAVAAVRPVALTGVRRRTAALCLLIAVPGVFLGHPNALLSLGLMVLTVLAAAAVQTMVEQEGRVRRRAGLALAALVSSTLAAVVLLPRISAQVAAVSAYDWKPTDTVTVASVDMLFNAPHDGPLLVGLSVFVALGAVAVIARYRSLAWALVSFVLFSVLYVLAAAVGTPLTQLFTGYWYNDSVRIAASNAVPGTLLAVAGMGAVNRGLRHLTARRIPTAERSRLATFGVPAVVAALFVGATLGVSHRPEARLIGHYYHPDTKVRTLVDSRRVASLKQLAGHLPKDAVVTGIPANGSPLIYALSDRRVLFTTLSPLRDPDRLTIGRYLDQASTRPEVCAALRRQHVQYAVTGKWTFWGERINHANVVGMIRLAGRPGFTRIASAGGYNLYRITACGGS
ncbi:DUF6541 family protein [Oryzihumus sp.]